MKYIYTFLMKRLFAFMLLCTFSLSTAYAGWFCVIPGKDSIQIKQLTDSLCKLQGGVAYDTQREAYQARKRMESDGGTVTMKYEGWLTGGGGTYTGETVNYYRQVDGAKDVSVCKRYPKQCTKNDTLISYYDKSTGYKRCKKLKAQF